MFVTFSDGATFSDRTLWRPSLFNIRRLRVFCDPAHRERSFELHRPLMRSYDLLEMTDSAGSLLEVWLSRDACNSVAGPRAELEAGAGVRGHIDLTPWSGARHCPVNWSPVHGLDADDAIVWATETFGPDNARKFRAALAEACAQAWADLPR